MTHTLVDKIVHDILKQPQTGSKPVVLINRPNYQRNKGQLRNGQVATLSVGQQNLAGVLQGLSNSSPKKQAVMPNLPSGALFPFAIKSAGEPAKTAPAAEFQMPPVKNASAQESSPLKENIIKAPDVLTNAKVFGQAQFIGTAAGHTLGYVIPNLDSSLRGLLSTDTGFIAVGVISSRQGAAAQIMAADEAVKKTNSSVIKLQLAKDDFGGTGHGVLILLGGQDVADVTRAVEITLEIVGQYQENVSQNQAGKIEIHFTACAAAALNQSFGAVVNQAFGIIIGAPAGVGLLMGDTALKIAPVNVVMLNGPSLEQAFANEVCLGITGDSASVKNALEAAKEVGIKVLSEFWA